MLHTPRFFFSSKCRLFHNATFFGSCVIHILYTGCVKLKKKSGAKGLISDIARPNVDQIASEVFLNLAKRLLAFCYLPFEAIRIHYNEE